MRKSKRMDEEERKFGQIYERYYALMYYVANNILHNGADAEEALQEAFLRIANNMSKINAVECPETKNFVAIICKNVALTMYKKRNRVKIEELSEYIPDESFDMNPQRVSQENEMMRIVVDSILCMPEKYRECLYLHFVLEYESREISALLDIKLETVRKRIQRGKTMLQLELEKRGVTYENE